MDKWVAFYRPYFQTEEEAVAFVQAVERLQIADPGHPAKIMMHQVQRLVSLADDIEKIVPGRAAMKVFFLLVCAENVAKMHAKFGEEGQSKAHVLKFFREFLAEGDRDWLGGGFVRNNKVLSSEDAVKLLYAVRNAVVHEGNYWLFDFASPEMAVISGDPEEPVIVRIQYSGLRDIVVRAGIQAVNTYVP